MAPRVGGRILFDLSQPWICAAGPHAPDRTVRLAGTVGGGRNDHPLSRGEFDRGLGGLSRGRRSDAVGDETLHQVRNIRDLGQPAQEDLDEV